jgi:hypothetical protein
MIKTLIKNVGSHFSINKFFNDLKSQGFSIGKMTLHGYLDHIEDAYLLFTVPLYSESVRQTQTNQKKIYAIDTGLVNAYVPHYTSNEGHFFENLIYLDLRRKGHEIYYYLTHSRYEVDFLSRDRMGKFNLFQIVWDTSDPETFTTKKRALTEAETELGIQGQIITRENYFEWVSQSEI